MNQTQEKEPIRILLVDDEEGILELYLKVLREQPRMAKPGRMSQLAAQLFGRKVEEDNAGEPMFELTFARQGTEALNNVERALSEENPYAVIFMDIRMPPGPDGVWAAERIRKIDPFVEIILVTGFSDIDPKEISRRVPPLDKLLYIEKPFFPQEIRHFASSLGTKWQTERELRFIKEDLEQLIKQRTSELEEANRRLIAEISEHERSEMLREFRGTVLERLGAGDSLNQVVAALATGIEYIRPEVTCAVLLPDHEKKKLTPLPAPGLPDYFLKALAGIPISAQSECCGQAAYLKQPVSIVNLDDCPPEFAELHECAVRAKIEACWARPILGETGVLGVLAVYFREKRTQSAFETRLVDSAVQIMRVAIERHHSEAERKKLLAAVEQNPSAIAITSPRGMVEYTNRRYTELTGIKPDDIIDTYIDLLDPEQKESEERLARLEAGENWEGVLISQRENGSTYHEQIVISCIQARNGQTTNLLVSREDISDRKMAEEERQQLESRLLQAQKMETIGTLAGGIAHDFNNMLTPILGYTEMAISELPKEDEIRGHLEHVMRASGRAKELVQQMLTFSRRGQSELEPIKIHLVVKEAIKLLRAGLPSTIQISQEVDEACGLVMANPTQLIQVLMNLSANAKHAMRQKGGVLKLGLRLEELDEERETRLKVLPEGQYARLSVEDTGKGIEPGHLVRVFEPFFTTKEAGEGTGLGLSVVHGIITGHQGEIFVESEIDVGTVFDIYLPITDKQPFDEERDEEMDRGGREHLLFVDDEEMIVHMSKTMLERQGFEVTAVTDSREAFELFMVSPDRYDLLITDQTMPHLTGVDLAGRVMALRPDIPVILLTGYSETVTEENCQELGIREFLMKPVRTSELTRTIRKVLDRKKESERV